MTRSISVGAPATGFERFLYTLVGQDHNGLPLSVLSVLARRDVDPWEEALQLSRLPEDKAVKRLIGLLGAEPRESVETQEPALATRLIRLLPRPRDPAPLVRNLIAEALSQQQAIVLVAGALFFVIYATYTLLSG